MKKMKINEIFYSVQGEGFYTGKPAIFIRFSGCNLKCDFCDTEHQNGKEMSINNILSQIGMFKCKFVVITGGEPTLQLSQELVNTLHNKGYYIAVESNGTIEPPKNIDWLTISPKYKKPIVTECNELKVVYEGQDMKQYDYINSQHKFVQPCDRKNPQMNFENLQKVINFVKENPQWRISLQTQKILKVQ